MPQVAEWKAAAWAQYAVSLGDNGKVDLNTSLSWIDDVYFSVFEAANLWSGAAVQDWT